MKQSLQGRLVFTMLLITSLSLSVPFWPCCQIKILKILIFSKKTNRINPQTSNIILRLCENIFTERENFVHSWEMLLFSVGGRN